LGSQDEDCGNCQQRWSDQGHNILHNNRYAGTPPNGGSDPSWGDIPLFLLNIVKRSLPKLMLRGVGLTSKGAARKLCNQQDVPGQTLRLFAYLPRSILFP
jgi:hypothetical protein